MDENDNKDKSCFCKEHSGVIVRLEHVEETQETVEGKLDSIHNRVTQFLFSALGILTVQVLYIIYKVATNG